MPITAITTCTGPLTVSNADDLTGLCSENPQQLQRVLAMTGIETRCIAPPGVTTLDLGEAAARHLLEKTNTDPAGIDWLLFVTQTPDHFQPCNANLLHHRLGLPKNTAAIDLNQGCSGWVYGLQIAHAQITAGARRVLLLAGDTISQTLHPRDRSARPLFGDACSATLIEAGDDPHPPLFHLCSDGSGHRAIKQPAGGFRQPLSEATAVESTDADGNVRTPANLHMNGLEVLNFTLREEPQAIRNLLAQAGQSLDELDAIVLHQASRFILDQLIRKLGVPRAKVPSEALARFGNLSSASIPSVLGHDLSTQLQQRSLRLLCSGFGVGLSWGSCLLTLGPLQCVDTFPFEQ
ncbi:MAG: ketoacyl-ACP synthase III [Opitutales bacterium]|nr:ketoacyl-ACP synthase III [Opitutales bacterium]